MVARNRQLEERALTVCELGEMVARAELRLRAMGRSLLGLGGTPVWIAERRAKRSASRAFRERDQELETGLLWLCHRGLVEVVGPQEDRYRWTRLATDDCLRRVAR